MYLKVGRFGPYVQRGTPDDEEKPKNASLLKGMKPADVDLATALKLLTLPRKLGEHPTTSEPIMAFNGRFGPYVKCGEETRSLPADISPLDVTLDQAVDLLRPAEDARPRRAAAKKRAAQGVREPRRSPRSRCSCSTAATAPTSPTARRTPRFPRARRVEELTFDEALALLADKAAAGPVEEESGAKRKTAPRQAAPKKVGDQAHDRARSGREEVAEKLKPIGASS